MFNFIRSLFSNRQTNLAISERIGADILNASVPIEHRLRNVNGRPSRTQIATILAETGKKEFDYYGANGDQFRFRLVQSGQVFRIDILLSPGYGNRPTDSHSTHRLNLGSGTPCICIKAGYEPRDMATAAGIAIDWARRSSQYIRDGREWNS